VKNLSRLPAVTCPKEISLGHAWAVVENDRARRLLPDHLEVPEVSCRNLEKSHFPSHGKILRRRSHPIEKRAPGCFRRLPVQPVEQHGNFNAVASLERDLLAPVAIEQVLVVETD
jgi:hypothetical protein